MDFCVYLYINMGLIYYYYYYYKNYIRSKKELNNEKETNIELF